VARASLEKWGKEQPQAQEVRKLYYEKNRSYMNYSESPSSLVTAADTLICLIFQTTYLLEQLLCPLEKNFIEAGGFTERLYQVRHAWRDRKK
jgi:four helix bundle suffix protein